MVRCTYLSVNGALEVVVLGGKVSVDGGEGVDLGGKASILLLQLRLGGRGPGDGRHGEGIDSGL
jgi:hypothetical protein